jgi:hypothetical protein
MALVHTTSKLPLATVQKQNEENNEIVKIDDSDTILDSWEKKPAALLHISIRNKKSNRDKRSQSISSSSFDSQNSNDHSMPSSPTTTQTDGKPKDTPPTKMRSKKQLKSKVLELTSPSMSQIQLHQSLPLAWDASTWRPRRRSTKRKEQGPEKSTNSPPKKYRMDTSVPVIAQYIETCTYPDRNTAAAEICRRMRNNYDHSQTQQRLFFPLSVSTTLEPFRPLGGINSNLSPYGLYRWLRVRMTAGHVRSSFSILHKQLQEGYEDAKNIMGKMNGGTYPEMQVPELLLIRDRLASLWCVYVHFTLEVGKVTLPDDKPQRTPQLANSNQISTTSRSDTSQNVPEFNMDDTGSEKCASVEDVPETQQQLPNFLDGGLRNDAPMVVPLKRSIVEKIYQRKEKNGLNAKVRFTDAIETSTSISTISRTTANTDSVLGAPTLTTKEQVVSKKTSATRKTHTNKPKERPKYRNKAGGNKKSSGRRKPKVTFQDIVHHAISLLWNARECPLVGNHTALSICLGRLLVSSTALQETKVKSNSTQMPRTQMLETIQFAIAACWDGIDPGQSDTQITDEFKLNDSTTQNIIDHLSLVDFKGKLHHEKRISHQTLLGEFKAVSELPQYLRARGGSLENTAFMFNDQNTTRCLCTELNRWSRLVEKLEVFAETTYKLKPSCGGKLAFLEEELPLFLPLDVHDSEIELFDADDENQALILWEW